MSPSLRCLENCDEHNSLVRGDSWLSYVERRGLGGGGSLLSKLWCDECQNHGEAKRMVPELSRGLARRRDSRRESGDVTREVCLRTARLSGSVEPTRGSGTGQQSQDSQPHEDGSQEHVPVSIQSQPGSHVVSIVTNTR